MKRTPYVILTLTVMLAACSKNEPPAEPTPTSTSTAAPPPASDPDAERRAREAEEARRRAEMERRMGVLSERVFFAYDRSDISSEAAATLQAKLPILRESPNIRLRIEGHADERGSIEYNLALGLRRAQAVKDYLSGYGIDTSRLVIESYGEDRPLDPASNERAWAQNRRAEFVTVSGN